MAAAVGAVGGVPVGDLPEFVFNSPLILQNPISLNFPRNIPEQREAVAARQLNLDPEVAEEDEDEEEEEE